MECEDGEVVSDEDTKHLADVDELQDEDTIPLETLKALGMVWSPSPRHKKLSRAPFCMLTCTRALLSLCACVQLNSSGSTYKCSTGNSGHRYSSPMKRLHKGGKLACKAVHRFSDLRLG